MNRIADNAVVFDLLLYEAKANKAEQKPIPATVQNSNCRHISQWEKSNTKSVIENAVKFFYLRGIVMPFGKQVGDIAPA